MTAIEITVDVTVDGEYLTKPLSRTIDMDAGSTPWMWAMAAAAEMVKVSRNQWLARLDMDEDR